MSSDPIDAMSQAELEEIIESWPVEPGDGTMIQRLAAWLAEMFGALAGDDRRIPQHWQ